MHVLALFLCLVFAWSLVSKRLERSVLTAPIAFTGAGALAASLASEAEVAGASRGLLLGIAEIGLVLLLFADASRANLRVVRASRGLPVRLLGIGMPLTIALGTGAALLVLPQL